MAIMNGLSSLYVLDFHNMLAGNYFVGEIVYPNPWFLRLSTTDFDTDMVGITIPVAVDYADFEYTATGSPKFGVSGSYFNYIYLFTDWEFPMALNDWGTITNFAIYSLDTAVEKPVIGGPLTTPTLIEAGSVAVFIRTSITCTVTYQTT